MEPEVEPRIQVHVSNQWFDPVGSRKSYEAKLAHGMTVDSLAPLSWLREDTVAILNGVRVDPDDMDAVPLAGGDVLVYAQVPGGEAFTLAAFVEALVSTIAVAGISFAIQAILPGQDPPTAQEDNSSQTYGWSGTRTVYDGIGLPSPFALGRGPALGGVVIQQWVENRTASGKPVAVLNLLILLTGPGPIGGVGGYTSDVDQLQGAALPTGMRINGNSAENYDGVIVSLRMGSIDQEPIPGFNQIRNTFQVDLPIDNVEDGLGSPTTDFSGAAAYDMTVAGEACIISVEAPGGLFNQGTSGDLAPETVELQVRYIELASGIPTGSYVTLDPYNFTGSDLGLNSDDYVFDLFDPATYVVPMPGNALDIPDNTAGLHSGSLTAPEIPGGTWSAGDNVDEMSMEFYIDVGQPSFVPGPIVSWCFGTAVPLVAGLMDPNLGISGFCLTVTDTGQNKVLIFQGGDASTSGVLLGGTANGSTFSLLNETGLNQVGFSYAEDPLGDGLHRWRLILNGAIAEELFSTTRLQIPTVISGGVNGLLVASWFYGTGFDDGAPGSMAPPDDHKGAARYDQGIVWARELDSGDWSTRWRSGVGTFETDYSDKVAGWDFTNAVTATDLSGNGNDLTFEGTTAPTIVTGYLANPGVNTVKPGTYRVEVQRRDNVRESTTIRDKVRFSQIQVIRYDEVNYGGWALAGVAIEATEQLSGTRPTITFEGDWVKGLVWDGVDPENPSLTEEVTFTPAWLEARYLLDEVQGMGTRIKKEDINWPAFLEWAEFSDEGLYDGRGTREVIIHSHQLLSGVDIMRLEFSFGTDRAWPEHWVVGQRIGLTGTTVSGPAWAQTIIDDNENRGYVIVDGPFSSGSVQGYLDVAWPSDLVTPPPSPTQWFPDVVGDTVEIRGIEPRHECGIVFDEREVGGWDGALRIARTGRAQLVRFGRRIRPKIAKPRPITHIFNASNMVAGSWTVTPLDPAQQFNQATADILDAERDYQRVPITRSISDLDDGVMILNPTSKSFEMRGVTRRTQAIRELDMQLRTARDLGFMLEFQAGLDSLAIESGDAVFVTIPTTNWANSGRVFADAADDEEFSVDLEAVLEVATTYRACVQSADDGRLYYAPVSSPAATYAAGSTISVSTPFTWTDPDDANQTLTHVPQEGDKYVLGEVSEITKSWEILDIGLAQGWRRNIRAVEYVDDVYIDTVAIDPGDSSPSAQSVEAPGALPRDILSMVVEDGTTLNAETGALNPGVYVAWTYPNTGQSTRGVLEGPTEIWVEPVGGTGGVAATVEAGRKSATVSAPWIKIGSSYTVTVRPTGLEGQKRHLSRCRSANLNLIGSVPVQDAPQSASMEMMGDKAVYSAVPAASLSGRSYPIEIRRGPGWFLAPRICLVNPDSSFTFGPTENWVILPTSAAGDGDSPLVARHRLPHGGYGAPFSIDPSPSIAEAGSTFRESSMEDDWEDPLDAGDPILFDSITLDVPTQTLGFTGTSTTGSYTSGTIKTGEAADQARRVHVSADFVAYQIPPYTVDDLDFSIGSKRAQNWTLEGPLDPNDPLFGQCNVDMRLLWTATSGSPVNDERFVPGEMFLKTCKLKVMVERPDDTWDVEIQRLAVRVDQLKGGELAAFIDGGSY